jgi:hypothetical protein
MLFTVSVTHSGRRITNKACTEVNGLGDRKTHARHTCSSNTAKLRHHEAHDWWSGFVLGVAGVSSVLNTQQMNDTHRVHHARILDVFRPVTNSLRPSSDKQQLHISHWTWVIKLKTKVSISSCPLLQGLRQRPMTRGDTLPWALNEFRRLISVGSERRNRSDR